MHDRATGETFRVSVDSDGNEADYESEELDLASNGHFVAFSCRAENLVPEDLNGSSADIFVRDLQDPATYLVSVSSAGEQADRASHEPSISDSGRYIAFYSDSTNLVPDDTNQIKDVFVHDRVTGETIRVSVDSDGNQASDLYMFGSYSPAISADGHYVAFYSYADNLVPNDSNGTFDVFIRGPLLEPEVLVVDIDIAWQRDSNQLNPDAGKLQVAVLTTETFDAADVDTESVLLFGPAEAQPIRMHMRDFDFDGDADLLLFFETANTGITCDDTEATLTGQTVDGQSFEGTDTVVPVSCP
jgi:hypothetical protein